MTWLPDDLVTWGTRETWWQNSVREADVGTGLFHCDYSPYAYTRLYRACFGPCRKGSDY